MRTYPIRVPKLFHGLIPEARFLLGKNQKQQYALTFDDGPNPSSTPLLLRLLDDLSIKVKFFLVGENASKYPSLVNEIQSSGHAIGSHGYTHLNGWKVNDDIYLDDINKSCDLLGTVDFRPPYGKISRKQYEELKSKYSIYLWSVMPGDYDSSVDSPTLLSRMRKYIKGRDVIVLHDTPDALLKLREVLPPLLSELTDKGLNHYTL